MSGGGVGAGDSLDMLNTSLLLSTCRADGLLLLPSRPLTVTPLQLQRMAARCQPSVPHSCIGEIWSGYTTIHSLFFANILVHENAGQDDSQADEVSVHLLGLTGMFDSSNCSFVYTGGADKRVRQVTLCHLPVPRCKLI